MNPTQFLAVERLPGTRLSLLGFGLAQHSMQYTAQPFSSHAEYCSCWQTGSARDLVVTEFPDTRARRERLSASGRNANNTHAGIPPVWVSVQVCNTAHLEWCSAPPRSSDPSARCRTQHPSGSHQRLADRPISTGGDGLHRVPPVALRASWSFPEGRSPAKRTPRPSVVDAPTEPALSFRSESALNIKRHGCDETSDGMLGRSREVFRCAGFT